MGIWRLTGPTAYGSLARSLQKTAGEVGGMPSTIDNDSHQAMKTVITAIASCLFLVSILAAQEEHSTAEQQERPANHLIDETSPYLLQHAHNPVDWYPWGPDALQRAKDEDKPIFLSVGYSACHWCHVMEHESFENEEIAKLMNQWFVCIKVDREERPDIDAIYMAAVQSMIGSGGWPMSVFLTPDLEPFYGGTYYPPHSRGGRLGFDEVLQQVHTFWLQNPAAAVERGQFMIEALRARTNAPSAAGKPPGLALLERAFADSKASADPAFGGFGRAPRFAPKFPRCAQLLFILRRGAREQDGAALTLVRKSLDQMAWGGMYDQLGGGFARYSTDRSWTVPHFEKMLYDNAQLALLYMEAWQALDQPFYREISREVLDYVAREMTGPEGGFYSATDADSEGEEGKFFVWSLSEVRAICGKDAAVAEAWFGVTKNGNFEGHNILTARSKKLVVSQKFGLSIDDLEAAIARCTSALLKVRAKRIPPALDDKRLASWNGLMLSAFARAAMVFDDERYLEIARANALFLMGPMRREGGGLFRTSRSGRAHLDAYLEDYALVAQGLLDLFEADQDPRWLRGAQELMAYLDEHFADESGGYFKTASYAVGLPVRMNSPQESSLPSAVGVALLNNARLGLLEGSTARLARARAGLVRHGEALRRWPSGHATLLLLIDFLEHEPSEVYIVGPADDSRVQAELARLRRQWPPLRVFVQLEPGKSEPLEALLPAAEGKTMVKGKPTVYVCHHGVCDAPREL